MDSHIVVWRIAYNAWQAAFANNQSPVLSLLSTHPDHQQRGAGSQLLKWGTDLADEAGLCCYLVASSKGYPLYCKKGFEDLDFIDIDTTKWGGNGIIRNVCMIRPCARE